MLSEEYEERYDDEALDLLSTVSAAYVAWAALEKTEDYKPIGYDEELSKAVDGYPLVKIIKKKLEWGGVDVVIPDCLAVILATCAETPADIQMMTVDILETVRENNNDGIFAGYIPKGYVITSSDFLSTFNNKLPLTRVYDDIREEYNHKWDMQKFKNDNGVLENMYDTKTFWDVFKNV